MRTRRGFDYARRLTDAQQRTLAGMLDRLPGPAQSDRSPATQRRPRRRAGLTAAAVAAVTLAIGLAVPILIMGRDPAATSAQRSAAVLRALADAAGRGAAQPALSTAYRHRLDVVVYGGTDECRFVAVDSKIWVPTGQPSGPTGTWMEVDVTEDPAGALRAAGCSPTGTPVPNHHREKLFNGPVADPAGAWTALAAPFREFPSYDSPWPVWDTFGVAASELPTAAHDWDSLFGPRCATGCDAPQWPALIGVLVSPDVTPAQRAGALQASAAWSNATVVPEVTADITGRPGITLRVPYPTERGEAIAELTFDERTGALLQRTVRDSATYRVEVTVFVDAAQVAGIS